MGDQASGQLPLIRPTPSGRVLIARFAEWIARLSTGQMSITALRAALQDTLSELDGALGPAGPLNQGHLDDWKRVFAYWQQATGSERARPNAEKRGKVLARLKSYSPEDLMRAVDGCLADPWHVEKRKHGLAYICQSDEKVERFLELAGEAPLMMAREGADRSVQAMEAAAMQALEDGDMEAYERLQQEMERAVRSKS